MKIPGKYRQIISGVLMALGMSFIMGLSMLLIKAGVRPGFFGMLMKEWALGFIISLLPSFVLPILINRLLGRAVQGGPEN